MGINLVNIQKKREIARTEIMNIWKEYHEKHGLPAINDFTMKIFGEYYEQRKEWLEDTDLPSFIIRNPSLKQYIITFYYICLENEPIKILKIFNRYFKSDHDNQIEQFESKIRENVINEMEFLNEELNKTIIEFMFQYMYLNRQFNIILNFIYFFHKKSIELIEKALNEINIMLPRVYRKIDNTWVDIIL